MIQSLVSQLAVLHEEGRIHGGVCPSAVQVDRFDGVRIEYPVRDRIKDLSNELLPASDELLECVDYMAPEMALNLRRVDQRVDVYSMGCIFYFALTGRPPFGEGMVAERLLHHQVTQPQPISFYRPSVPFELENLCRRMLEKKPTQRPRHMTEVFMEFDKWLSTYGE